MVREVTSAEPLDPDALLGLMELCQICGVERELVVGLIEEGVIEPAGGGRAEPAFTAVAVHRVRVVHRLQRDLGVNRAGAGLAVDLLDEIHRLRRRLRRYEA